MKHLLVVICLLCAVMGKSRAQVDRVDLYADETLATCEIAVSPPQIVTVHIVHSGLAPSRGVRFYAPKPACMGDAAYLGDTWFSPVTGTYSTTQSDVSAVYLDCQQLPVYLGMVRYFLTSLPDVCCEYRAAPVTVVGEIVAVDCEFTGRPGEPGHRVVLNPNDTCRCDLPLPVNNSTWGGVKALYR